MSFSQVGWLVIRILKMWLLGKHLCIFRSVVSSFFSTNCTCVTRFRYFEFLLNMFVVIITFITRFRLWKNSLFFRVCLDNNWRYDIQTTREGRWRSLPHMAPGKWMHCYVILHSSDFFISLISYYIVKVVSWHHISILNKQ